MSRYSGARSSQVPQVCQAAYPCGSGAALGSATLVRSRNGYHRPGSLLLWLCCFQGFSSHQCGGKTGTAQVSHYHSIKMSLFALTVFCAGQLSYQDVQTVQGTHLFWIFWDYLRHHYPGRALGRWELSARHKVWVFAEFVPICQVLAARGSVLCRLLKRIQSHSNYYCSC